MRTLALVIIVATTLCGCGLMPPRRQYIKEAKRQTTPQELLNTHWLLESRNGNKPDCELTMDFFAKGRFTFKWNELNFSGDNLWYIVKDSSITFHTRPIEKIVWTHEQHELEPDNFALDLLRVNTYSVDGDKLILKSPSLTYIFVRKQDAPKAENS